MEPQPESRAHPRAKAHIKVDYHHGTTTGIGHTADISEGGLYLVCDHPAKPGARVYMRLYLPGGSSGDPLKLIGVVKRATNRAAVYDETPPGMAIAFQVAYSRTKQELHDFMEMLFDEGSVASFVDTLPGDGGPPAYIARFPDIEGQARARTIPPADLEAAFSFTASAPGTTDVAHQDDKSEGRSIRIAVVVVALAIVAYIAARAAGFV
jgi:PilZ domain